MKRGFVKIARLKIARYGDWRDYIIPASDVQAQPGTPHLYPFDLEAILKEFPEISQDRDRFLFVTATAVRAGEHHGPNDNGDFFPEEELKNSYQTFVRKGVYINHDSESVDKAIGVILAAHWDDENKEVLILEAINRDLAPDVVRKIEQGIITDVSMGCYVEEAECSRCGKVIHSDAELCECLNMLRSGGYRQGGHWEVNRGITFIECSAITEDTQGADRGAKYREKLARKIARLLVEGGLQTMRRVKHAQENQVPPAPAPPPEAPVVEEEPLVEGEIVEMLYDSDGNRLVTVEPSNLSLEDILALLKQHNLVQGDVTKESLTADTFDIIGVGDKQIKLRVSPTLAPGGEETPSERVSKEEPPEGVSEEAPPELPTTARRRKRSGVPQLWPSQQKDEDEEEEEEDWEKAIDYVAEQTKKGKSYEQAIREARRMFGNKYGKKEELKALKGKDEDSLGLDWGKVKKRKPTRRAQQAPVPPSSSAEGVPAASPPPLQPLKPEDSSEGPEDAKMRLETFQPGDEVVLRNVPATVKEVTDEGKVVVSIEGLDQAVLADQSQVSSVPEDVEGQGDRDYEDEETLGGIPPSVLKAPEARKRSARKRRFRRAQADDAEEALDTVEELVEEMTDKPAKALSQDQETLRFVAELVERIVRGEAPPTYKAAADEIAEDLGLGAPPNMRQVLNVVDIYLRKLLAPEDEEDQDEAEEKEVSEVSARLRVGSKVITPEGYLGRVTRVLAGGRKVAVRLVRRSPFRVGALVRTPEGYLGRVTRVLAGGRKVAVRLVRRRAQEAPAKYQGPTYDQNKPVASPLPKPEGPEETWQDTEAKASPEFPADDAYPKDTGPEDVSPTTVEAARLQRQYAALKAELEQQKRVRKAERVVELVDLMLREGAITQEDVDDQSVKLMAYSDEQLNDLEQLLTNFAATRPIAEPKAELSDPVAKVASLSRIPRTAAARPSSGGSWDKELQQSLRFGMLR